VDIAEGATSLRSFLGGLACREDFGSSRWKCVTSGMVAFILYPSLELEKGNHDGCTWFDCSNVKGLLDTRIPWSCRCISLKVSFPRIYGGISRAPGWKDPHSLDFKRGGALYSM